HHGAIVASGRSDIKEPKQLEGCRVGVKRGFTVTTGVWARAILAEECGVDLGKVTWVRSDDEHVPDWRPPANVEDLGGQESLEERLVRGDIPAAVGLTADDGTRPLIADAFQAGVSALTSRGFYPINHLVVIRDDILDAAPDLAGQLFDAFAASKRAYVEDLRAGRISDLTAVDRVHHAALEVMDDPLPYGIAPNLAVLENLMRHAVSQGIIDAPIPMEGLFAPTTLDRVG
ncbi:MAG: ABC transporter substrate-binding protein, partial [Alphaproteobacteria bacterium]|nr:ABC transporter substrate-binding protein [Alphaproteobacteria bacterium]